MVYDLYFQSTVDTVDTPTDENEVVLVIDGRQVLNVNVPQKTYDITERKIVRCAVN